MISAPIMKRFFAALLVILLFAVCTVSAFAEDMKQETIQQQQKKIKRIQEGIKEQKQHISKTGKKESGLLSELADLDKKLNAERERMNELKKELEKQEKLIQLKQKEAEKSRALKSNTQPKVENRLRAYYTMGPLGLMNVLFSSNSLPDLLTFDEYFQRMLVYDEQLVDDYRLKIEGLAKSKKELEAQKQELVAVISQVKEQEKSLSASRKERKELLDRVKNEKRLYQQALKELEVAASNLSDTMKNLKKEAEQASQQQLATASQSTVPSKRRPDDGNDFISQKGWLDPPVSGTVTTQFGKNTSEQFNITTFVNGIDIRTSGGANVKAIYNGSVVFSGFLQGYGNLIIIDHGQQYFSLVARMAKLLRKEGEDVTRGEVIGIMDEAEGLLGEGLHFEIRRGTDPENPLHWINNAKLKIQSTGRINR